MAQYEEYLSVLCVHMSADYMTYDELERIRKAIDERMAHYLGRESKWCDQRDCVDLGAGLSLPSLLSSSAFTVLDPAAGLTHVLQETTAGQATAYLYGADGSTALTRFTPQLVV